MATALPSFPKEQQSYNLDEYSDDSDAESKEVRKAKKSKKPGNSSTNRNIPFSSLHRRDKIRDKI